MHQKEFDKNIKWGNCPVEEKDRITSLIKQHWDCFVEEGLKKHIRGFSCRVDTGTIEPVCCKPPRYGPHETEVMTKLCQQLQDNGLIEDDDGPWGALIVLAAKANQEDIQWSDYVWRLCVSYRRLNQVVRPFQFPIRRCDDAVADIPPWAKYFLSFDLDSGYWQVELDAESRYRTAFFSMHLKGFYAAWLERYEFRIRPYRRLQSLQPTPGQLIRVQETELMKTLWLPEHQALFEQLQNEILAKPVLARPESNRRFYIKTDWCSNGMAAALLQADPDDLEALDAEAVESIGGPCFFDLQKKGIRLRPIEFISRATSMAEKSFHSYVGEASVARWAFPRWKRYLLGRVFTWLSDCSGLKRFFDGDDHPTHTIQRWRAELLQYVFTLEHRPAEMLTECDVLSRYNMATSEWYDTTTANDTDVIEPTVPAAVSAARVLPTIASIFDPIELEDNRKPTSWYSLPSIMRIGHPTWPSSNIATMATSQERVILVTGAATVPIDHALDLLGVDGTILRFDTGIPNEYANRLRLARQNHFFANLHTLEGSRIDWFLAVYTDQPSDDGKPDQRLNNWFETSLNQALALIQAVNLKAAMIMCPIVFPSAARIAHSRVTAPSGWQFRIITLRNTYHGGSIETDHEVFLLLRDDAANAFSLPIITSTPGAMNEIIDIDPDLKHFFG